jgi:hypothetical protein
VLEEVGAPRSPDTAEPDMSTRTIVLLVIGLLLVPATYPPSALVEPHHSVVTNCRSLPCNFSLANAVKR